MPGFITHYICGEATLNILSPDIQTTIRNNRQLYNVGCQGPDMFFYYLPGLIKKNLRNLGVDMHKTNFRLFVSGLIDGLDEAADEESQSLVFSYLSGYLSHYTLDYHAHPYVYYKSGFQVKGDKTPRLRYSVYHRNFETAIDVLMLKLMSSEKPSDKKLWQLIKADEKHARAIAALLSKAIGSAYNRNITSKEVFSAMRYMVNLTRLLQSKKGKRKRLMELAEDLTIGEHAFSSIIHMQEIKDGIDYLNMHKNPWFMPWDDQNELTSSFAEMYNFAVSRGAKLITKTRQYMEGTLSREKLLDSIGNRSLASGMDCDQPVEFRVHDNVFA
ncbi:MAG: zinc dependent phospholipase C family protein [Clostridiales bacterium]|jgi:hypothetical protein|nr:zinc dependent phospholipase C family protein [Clostridiales bacterium]